MRFFNFEVENKCNFQTFEFQVKFNDSMVLHCLKWSQKPIKFRAANATFEEECVKEKLAQYLKYFIIIFVGSKLLRRFLSMLLAIEVNHVILRESAIASEIENKFLEEFSRVADPSIEVCDYADWNESGTENDVSRYNIKNICRNSCFSSLTWRKKRLKHVQHSQI